LYGESAGRRVTAAGAALAGASGPACIGTAPITSVLTRSIRPRALATARPVASSRLAAYASGVPFRLAKCPRPAAGNRVTVRCDGAGEPTASLGVGAMAASGIVADCSIPPDRAAGLESDEP